MAMLNRKYGVEIPLKVQYIIDGLRSSGYEAFVVGGCVRDCLMGNEPKDWDVCTSATPEKIKEVFPGDVVVPTGEKHGTVTVILGEDGYEVTTYRIDGDYSDGRRPDDVEFTDNVVEDLRRRDFTINAMAFNGGHIVDPFDGWRDIEGKTIKCVGEPHQRFAEDGLRILRAIRFSSTLGFHIEENTGKALLDCRHLLKKISRERIRDEILKTLMGSNARNVMSTYREVIGEVIPELRATFDFDQRDKHHHLDIWEHQLAALENAPENEVVRLAAFFHDVGKPDCFFLDEEGAGHFCCHELVGSDITGKVLSRLKLDNERKAKVLMLIKNHSIVFDTKSNQPKRMLHRLGEDGLKDLIELKLADGMAQNPEYRAEKIETIMSYRAEVERIIEDGQCFSLADLAIDGRDLLEVGIDEGRQVGQVLQAILSMVIEEDLENSREILLKKAEKLRDTNLR